MWPAWATEAQLGAGASQQWLALLSPVGGLFVIVCCGTEVVPVLADDRKQALETGREMYPGQRVAVVLQQSEPGGEVD